MTDGPLVHRRQGGALVGSKLVTAAVSAGWIVLAARRLPVDQLADLTLVLALGVIVVQVADSGLSILAPAQVARTPGALGAIALRAARLRLWWGLVAAAAFALAYAVAGARPSAGVAVAFSVSFVATAAHSALAACLRAVGRVRLEVVTEVGGRLAVASMASLVVVRGGGLLQIGLVYATVDVAVALVFWRALRREGHGPWPQEALSWPRRRHLAASVPLATAYWRMDIWFLALLSTSTEVARYGVAYRLLDAALLPAMALSSLLPGVVATASAPELRRRVRRASREAVATVVPLLAVAAVGTGPVLRLLFGADLGNAATGPFRVLALAAVPSAVALVGSQVLATVDARRYARSVVGIAGLSVGLCLVLLGPHGAIGAAGITLGCQLLYARLLSNGIRTATATAARDADAVCAPASSSTI